MNVQTRAQQFLHRLVRQPKVTVDLSRTGNDSKIDASGRFARCVKFVLPAILASAATYALVAPPDIEMRVSHSAPIPVQDMKQVFMASFPDLSRIDTIAECIYARMSEQGFVQAHLKHESQLSLMLGLASASSQKNAEIDAWVQETGGNPDLAVAALCENPQDWRGQLRKWEDFSHQQEILSPESWLDVAVNRAWADFGMRVQTAHLVAQEAANVRDLYGARAIKVAGTDVYRWMDAASSIANGAASFFGKDVEHGVRDATSSVRQGQQRYRQAENIGNRREGYDKARSVGDLLRGLGTDVQRHQQKLQLEQQRAERERQRRAREIEQAERRYERELQRLERVRSHSSSRYR